MFVILLRLLMFLPLILMAQCISQTTQGLRGRNCRIAVAQDKVWLFSRITCLFVKTLRLMCMAL
uniref:Uncharacterized protein n=1 Tax=uncultured marine virus TaxID=186617 RepID=A0A0F7L337_9VIRU|nr:hypothetical protein [uncultured marine virus]